MKLKPTMFREYDIRGREADDELTPQSMEMLGRGYGTFLSRREIRKAVVGRDSRATSEEFQSAFIRGMQATGCNVHDIGLSTTPMLYWAQFHFECVGGAAVTASHNPAGWNGVKLAVGYSQTTNSDQLQEIYKIIEDEDFSVGKGIVSETPVDDLYINDLISRVSIKGSPKLLLNTGNGTAGIIAPRLLRAAGCEVVELHTRLDPTFPHYPANPSIVEMMEDTGAHVRASSADLGVAIDADGDRLGITNENGETVWPDIYMVPLVRDLLEEKPGARIIFDVKCSVALEEEILKHGGIPIMWKTGHSHIKEKIIETKADLGIELSGHIFIVHGYYGFDDALFSALKLVESLSSRGTPLSRLSSAHDKWVASPVFNAHCADEEKYKVVDELVRNFKAQNYKVIDLNGARVVFEDGWGLVRASSNLPQLVLRFEARNKSRLGEIEELFRQLLGQYNSVSNKWETG